MVSTMYIKLFNSMQMEKIISNVITIMKSKNLCKFYIKLIVVKGKRRTELQSSVGV